MELSNVQYLPKLDANLIPLGVFKGKKCEFPDMNSLLQIKNRKNDFVLECIKANTVHLLQ